MTRSGMGEWRRVGTAAAVVVSDDGAGCEGARLERGDGGTEVTKQKRRMMRKRRWRWRRTVSWIRRNGWIC